MNSQHRTKKNKSKQADLLATLSKIIPCYTQLLNNVDDAKKTDLASLTALEATAAELVKQLPKSFDSHIFVKYYPYLGYLGSHEIIAECLTKTRFDFITLVTLYAYATYSHSNVVDIIQDPPLLKAYSGTNQYLYPDLIKTNTENEELLKHETLDFHLKSRRKLLRTLIGTKLFGLLKEGVSEKKFKQAINIIIQNLDNILMQDILREINENIKFNKPNIYNSYINVLRDFIIRAIEDDSNSYYRLFIFLIEPTGSDIDLNFYYYYPSLYIAPQTNERVNTILIVNPLLHAAIKNNSDAINYIVANKSARNLLDKPATTYCSSAVITFNEGTTTPVEFDDTNLSLLHIATIQSHNAIVQQLINLKTPINLRTEQGYTALFKAVKSNDVELVKILIDAGENPYIRNNLGENAIEYAKNKQNKIDEQILKLLTQDEIKYSLSEQEEKHEHKARQVMAICRANLKAPLDLFDSNLYKLLKEVQQIYHKIMLPPAKLLKTTSYEKLLIKSLNQLSNKIILELHNLSHIDITIFAHYYGYIGYFGLTSIANKLVNLLDYQGLVSVISYALPRHTVPSTYNHHQEKFEDKHKVSDFLFYQLNACSKAANFYRHKKLDQYFEENRNKIRALLISLLDKKLKDNTDAICFIKSLASISENQDTELLQYIIDRCESYPSYKRLLHSEILHATDSADDEKSWLLLYMLDRVKTNLNFTFNYPISYIDSVTSNKIDATACFNLLHLLIYNKDWDALLLLAHNPSLDINSVYHLEQSPDNKLESDAADRLDIKNIGQAPLHIAVENGLGDFVKYLILKCDANIDVLTHDGYTPLMIAVKENEYDIAEFLLTQSANTQILTPDGKTAYQLALDAKFSKIAKLIILHEQRKAVQREKIVAKLDFQNKLKVLVAEQKELLTNINIGKFYDYLYDNKAIFNMKEKFIFLDKGKIKLELTHIIKIISTLDENRDPLSKQVKELFNPVAAVAADLKSEQGAKVMVSNATSPDVKEVKKPLPLLAAPAVSSNNINPVKWASPSDRKQRKEAQRLAEEARFKKIQEIKNKHKAQALAQAEKKTKQNTPEKKSHIIRHPLPSAAASPKLEAKVTTLTRNEVPVKTNQKQLEKLVPKLPAHNSPKQEVKKEESIEDLLATIVSEVLIDSHETVAELKQELLLKIRQEISMQSEETKPASVQTSTEIDCFKFFASPLQLPSAITLKNPVFRNFAK